VRAASQALGRDGAGRSGLAPVLLRQGLAGALGGFLVFLLLEPVRRASGWGRAGVFDGLNDPFLPGILVGGIITCLLVAADEWAMGSPARAYRRGIASLILGAVLGSGYSIIGFAVYESVRFDGGAGSPLLARGVGWGLFGLGVGLSAGIIARSGRRSYQGCAGGLAGGFVGGVFFEFLSRTTANDSLRLLTGFVILGAAVGLATALVEHLSRAVWLQFLTGTREGQQVPLHRDRITLGRDELADVPLFGDQAVERSHAVILLTPAPAIREVALRNAMHVDGQPVREAPLSDGSLVEIGKHRFRFHQRGVLAPSRGFVPPIAVLMDTLTEDPADPASLWGARPVPAPVPAVPGLPLGGQVGPADHTLPRVVNQVVSGPPAPRPATDLLLRIVAGGNAGSVIPLSGASVTLGREAGNTVQLADARVSRFHARIDFMDRAWVLSDLGSTNGTRLNGVRVTRAGLAPGDWIYLGDTVIAVESGSTALPAGSS
jgi:pSer/pThr/pTyr-binding forkhead associated (FHA) protein